VLPSREFSRDGQVQRGAGESGRDARGEGLHSSAKGVRVKFGGGKSTVTTARSPETKELIAGSGCGR